MDLGPLFSGVLPHLVMVIFAVIIALLICAYHLFRAIGAWRELRTSTATKKPRKRRKPQQGKPQQQPLPQQPQQQG